MTDSLFPFKLRVRLPIIIGESDAGVISPGCGFIDAFDYAMQMQVGCPGGCAFCYVAGSVGLTPPDVRRNWGLEVRFNRHCAPPHGRSG